MNYEYENFANDEGMLPIGEIIESLARSDINGVDLYEAIARILLCHSFPDANAAQYMWYMRVSMPEMDRRLRLEDATLKIAIDAPMALTSLKAKNLRRGSEKQRNILRQLMEASLICILYVLITRRDPGVSHLFNGEFNLFSDIDSVVSAYCHHKVKRAFPFQAGHMDDEEQRMLIQFANFARVALLLMPLPKKAILLELVTKVAESSSRRYVCGNGQTAFVSRRVAIYEVTAKIPPPSRPFRSVFRKARPQRDDSSEDEAGDADERSDAGAAGDSGAFSDAESVLPELPETELSPMVASGGIASIPHYHYPPLPFSNQPFSNQPPNAFSFLASFELSGFLEPPATHFQSHASHNNSNNSNHSRNPEPVVTYCWSQFESKPSLQAPEPYSNSLFLERVDDSGRHLELFDFEEQGAFSWEPKCDGSVNFDAAATSPRRKKPKQEACGQYDSSFIDDLNAINCR